MNPTNFKRSIVHNGRKTSVSLEEEFWVGLREIACAKKTKLTNLMQLIDQERDDTNLSSAIRVFVFNHLRGQLAGVQVRPIEEVELKDHITSKRSRPINGSSVDNAPRR
jgi:predicted DNA-binding ribbon-helix-helix protein